MGNIRVHTRHTLPVGQGDPGRHIQAKVELVFDVEIEGGGRYGGPRSFNPQVVATRCPCCKQEVKVAWDAMPNSSTLYEEAAEIAAYEDELLGHDVMTGGI